VDVDQLFVTANHQNRGMTADRFMPSLHTSWLWRDNEDRWQWTTRTHWLTAARPHTTSTTACSCIYHTRIIGQWTAVMTRSRDIMTSPMHQWSRSRRKCHSIIVTGKETRNVASQTRRRGSRWSRAICLFVWVLANKHLVQRYIYEQAVRVATQYAPARCTPDAAAQLQLQLIPYPCGAQRALLPIAVGAMNINELMNINDIRESATIFSRPCKLTFDLLTLCPSHVWRGLPVC